MNKYPVFFNELDREHCVCSQDWNWSEEPISKICSLFEPDPFYKDVCYFCQHDEACHTGGENVGL